MGGLHRLFAPKQQHVRLIDISPARAYQQHTSFVLWGAHGKEPKCLMYFVGFVFAYFFTASILVLRFGYSSRSLQRNTVMNPGKDGSFNSKPNPPFLEP